ncbi:MAG: hypothetical protein HOW73_17120 [Polyangiaceae bacterium]|nr:hypothetical protein [Polyangiaceae bacterium]
MADSRIHVPDGANPIPMRIPCPACHELHIDEGDFATKPHHTHACQHCGNVWRPALVATVGVRFLPGFKNEEPTETPRSNLQCFAVEERYDIRCVKPYGHLDACVFPGEEP